MKLKANQVKSIRDKMIQDQNGLCLLCNQVINVPCLDHNHKTGAVRGVLCRRCNALEGKIRNAAIRCGITSEQLKNILGNITQYQSRDTGYIHHTHRTPEQKAELQKKRVKRRKAVKLASKTCTE